MRSIHLTNLLLLIITVWLGVIAMGPLFQTLVVHSQSAAIGQLPIAAFVQLAPGDPVSLTLPSSGPYFLDTATGKIWGYPVAGEGAFGPAILIGTFTQPGQPIVPPSAAALSP